MGTIPPGWYRDDHGRLRWWDSREWSDPDHDPRLRPGTQSVVDSVVLRFVADERWPPPPPGWFPPPLWQPETAWPDPKDDLWQVGEHGPELHLEQLTDVAEILSAEAEISENAWRLEHRDDIPVVWASPPGWPKPPAGWFPPHKWRAPREWGPPPSGWQFWQPDPSVISFRIASIQSHADSRSRALVETTVGIVVLLSSIESLLCDITRITPLALSPLPTAARRGFPVGAPSHLAERLRSAHQELNQSISNLRTYLLRIAYGLGVVDEWLWKLRRAVLDARDMYVEAAKNAAEGVLSATVEEVKREVARLNPKDRLRASLLEATLGELAGDIEARTNALRIASGSASLPTPSTLTADWERAEDLAATHLRGLGYRDARRTPVGTDGGFDVEGRGVVAQVKYRATAVGRPDVQRLVGANRHGATAVFYSRAGYSQGAIDFAMHADVALFRIDAGSSTVVPVNDLARDLDV